MFWFGQVWDGSFLDSVGGRLSSFEGEEKKGSINTQMVRRMVRILDS